MEIDQASSEQVRITWKKTVFFFYPDCEKLPKSFEQANAIMVACPSTQVEKLADKNTRLIIDGAGEYEIDDFSIQGIQVSTEPIKTIYRLTSPDGIKLVLLPEISPSLLTDKVLESIGLVSLLVVPAGQLDGKYSPVETAKIVRTLSPKVVIPLGNQADILEKFITEVGGIVHKDEKAFKTKQLLALEEGQHIFSLA